VNELKKFASFKGQNFCSLVGSATKNNDEGGSTLNFLDDASRRFIQRISPDDPRTKHHPVNAVCSAAKYQIQPAI